MYYLGNLHSKLFLQYATRSLYVEDRTAFRLISRESAPGACIVFEELFMVGCGRDTTVEIYESA